MRCARWARRRRGAAISWKSTCRAAAGIGGGSADAAAALRALAELWDVARLPAAADVLALGADVPACLIGRAGADAGHRRDRSPRCRPCPTCGWSSSTPRVAVPTPRGLYGAGAAPTIRPMPEQLPDLADADAGAAGCRRRATTWRRRRGASRRRSARCWRASPRSRAACLARMSGSGATCFGLFGGAGAPGCRHGRLDGAPGLVGGAAPMPG